MLDRTYNVVELLERKVCLVDFAAWLKATTRITDAYFITFFWWVITKKPLSPPPRFRCLFVQLLPCISLVILNILLFSAMRRAEQRRRRLTINKTKPVKKPRVARKNTMAR